MFRHIARLLVVGCVVLGVSLAWAFSAGPPIARTGAIGNATYPAEFTCANGCHTGSALNDPNGKLEILDIPSGYVANQVYTLRVRLHYDLAPATAKWGFELVAIHGSDLTGAGTLILPNPGPGPAFSDSLLLKTSTAGAYLTSGRFWIEHSTFATRTNQLGPVEWHFNWKAPAADEGKVYFFAAGNAANGDGSSSGDHIFTTVDSVFFTNGVPATGGPSWLIVIAAGLILSGSVVLVRRAMSEPTA